MRLRFDEDARREYLDAMVFYSGSGEKIGVKFADAVELAITKMVLSRINFERLKRAFDAVG